jgi:DeoR/GlpR family transcriptional regulator of sugar metabolism
MLAAQRHRRIVEEVQRTGAVRVTDLTRVLGVSDMTVRRDLDVLTRRGLVEKVHGGATVPGSGRSVEPGFDVKLGQEYDAKRAIAAAAVRLIGPGTAVAVSGGTTTYALALELAHVRDLTIVTNSMRVAEVLHREGREANQTVILTGGVRTPSDALVGPVAVRSITSLHVDCVFMGVHGIDQEAGFTTPNLLEAETDQAMVAASRRLVVVADHTKWGVVGLSAIAGLDEAEVLVTDAGLPDEAREALVESVGELLIADDPSIEESGV